MRIIKRYPTWDNTTIYEVSGKQSIKNSDTCVIKLTEKHVPVHTTSEHTVITWEHFEQLTNHNKIINVFAKDINVIFLLTDWNYHISNDLNTKYGVLRTGDTMCSLVTPGLLKALLRIYTTNAKGIIKKTKGSEQLKCEQEHTQGRKGEREGEGYLAWRSRVF